MTQLEMESKLKSKRKRRVIIGSILALVGAGIAAANLLPVRKIEEHAFSPTDRPLVIAHQGGENLAPSNTIEAFSLSKELGVDVLEFDIHITKDGQLVAIHDPTIDRTTNGSGAVADYTLEELQQFDAGYHFKDLDGEFSYRDQGVYIPSVEELFQQFGEMKMVIEIKDDNPEELLDDAAKELWRLIDKYKMADKVIVASFDQKILELYENYSQGTTAIAGGKQEVTKFVVFHKFFLRNLYQPKVEAFQIPTEESIFDLTDKLIIDGAHRRGQAVHYWTIDDKETMRKLLNAGADGIMTNRPDLLLEVMEEMGY